MGGKRIRRYLPDRAEPVGFGNTRADHFTFQYDRYTCALVYFFPCGRDARKTRRTTALGRIAAVGAAAAAAATTDVGVDSTIAAQGHTHGHN